MSHPAAELGDQDQAPAAPAAVPLDWRRDQNFRWPDRVPWSQLSPQFTMAWGRSDPANPQPEHLEMIGPSGSGKTYLEEAMLQDRYAMRRSGAVLCCTKVDDNVFGRIGWPIVGKVDELAGLPNAVFWPRTKAMGNERRAFHDRVVSDFLHQMWRPQANTIIGFDEIGYVEGLSGNVRALVQQYWREGRALGITVLASKQRPQGVQRDMHSETYWTVAFKPNDRGDFERWAELFGPPRDWMPVLHSLNANAYEFIIRHSRSEEAYISWVDRELVPQKVEEGKTYESRIRTRRA